jgi:ribose/xylose/arabinose/galactoside ABC-type transport system permease subunit
MPIYLFGAGVDSFFKLGRGYLAGIPLPVVMAIVLALIGWVVLHHSRYGFRLYSIGGNPRAALVQGIPVTLLRWSAFVVGGLSASICGLFVASYASSGTVQGADQFLFSTIVSVYIGTIISPVGLVTIGGTIFGALIVAVLSNILAMLQVPYYGEFLFKGFLLFAVVLLSRNRYRQK